MKAFVVVATKGRSKETFVLLDHLVRQSMQMEHVFVVGSEASDVSGLDAHPMAMTGSLTILLSKAGSALQRNTGLDALKQYVESDPPNKWFVVFFDDDYRPARDWLENAANGMRESKELVGITGNVLADGVSSEFGISEEDAQKYLSGQIPPQSHWSNSNEVKLLEGAYGCNMAFRGNVAASVRFDENLPLYGWQEDYDFASRARKHGLVVLYPSCKGVHLGSSSGRTSGVRFGYSQIANPIYLANKGTMSWRKAGSLISKNMMSNLVRTLTGVRIKDFPGRLRGNIRAWRHFIVGRLDPRRVLEI